MAEVARLAAEVAGERHHFFGVQLPVNLAMPEAIAYPSQVSPSGRVSALEAAREMGLAAFGSASILQGRLAAPLPEEIEAAFAGRLSGRRAGAPVPAIRAGNDLEPRRRFDPRTRSRGLRPREGRAGRSRGGPGPLLLSRSA